MNALIKRCAMPPARRPVLNVFFIIIGLFVVNAAQAQQCEPHLPCGPLPWQIPALPNLTTATPIPTVIFTTVPTAGGTITATPTTFPSATPAPSVTPFWNATEMAEQIGTLQSQVDATTVPVLDFGGEPVNTSEITAETSALWNYIKGLTLYDFGVFSPLMTAFLLTFVFVISFKVLMIAFPALVYLFGFLRRIIDFILGFIPG